MVKSKNSTTVVGKIVETNFKYDAEATNLFDPSIKGAYVRDDFKNPSFLRVAVERHDDKENPEKVTSTATVRVNMFNVFEEYNNKDGKRVKNTTFEELKKIANSENGGKGLPIQIRGTYAESKYATDDLKISRSNVFNGQYISLSNIDLDKSKADGELTGVIGAIKDEIVNDSETGRKLVDFYTVKSISNGTPKVDYLTLIVDESLADAFDGEFEAGDSASLSVEMKDVKHGKVENVESSKGFGSRKVETTSGYTATEFQIFNGFVLDEGDANYIDEDEFETLLKAHDIECSSLIQKKMAKKNGGATTTTATEPTFANPFEEADEVLPF